MKEVEVGHVFYNADKSSYGKVTKVTEKTIYYEWYNLSKVKIVPCSINKKRFYGYLYTVWKEVTPVEQELF